MFQRAEVEYKENPKEPKARRITTRYKLSKEEEMHIGRMQALAAYPFSSPHNLGAMTEDELAKRFTQQAPLLRNVGSLAGGGAAPRRFTKEEIDEFKSRPRVKPPTLWQVIKSYLP